MVLAGIRHNLLSEAVGCRVGHELLLAEVLRVLLLLASHLGKVVVEPQHLAGNHRVLVLGSDVLELKSHRLLALWVGLGRCQACEGLGWRSDALGRVSGVILVATALLAHGVAHLVASKASSERGLRLVLLAHTESCRCLRVGLSLGIRK